MNLILTFGNYLVWKPMNYVFSILILTLLLSNNVFGSTNTSKKYETCEKYVATCLSLTDSFGYLVVTNDQYIESTTLSGLKQSCIEINGNSLVQDFNTYVSKGMNWNYSVDSPPQPPKPMPGSKILITESVELATAANSCRTHDNAPLLRGY
ncbi:MAG: hypothetical protein HOO06_04120 [Bdellovibrionaceae bacterium]|nr:hypothetical protein [Pseudobdellovibrionaceae bacterium]